MSKCISKEQIVDCLVEMKNLLLAKKPIKITENGLWIKSIKCKAGVYLFLNNHNPYYVGESANVEKRMRDFTQTRNHTLRRKIGSRIFVNSYLN